ncbi:TBC1 domain family member 5 homolog A-like [Arachis ipaensis]|uniref:TBC1 domain family member 5 homolog A-like n=1 Tax=Arachis ipaensis TaxID=130454 RepID=UPI0007AF8B53|nr:TBC1 domain family member 5 homolog A-like [Arachis ipaensis]XP_025635966.1 TBC1 domain family member 5 homolog A-like [Arachis hypogaea]
MKTAEKVQNLIDTVTNNQYFYGHQRQCQPAQQKGVLELEGVDTILAQNKVIHQQIQQQIEMMAKRIDGLQIASVGTTNQSSVGWGQNEEIYKEQQPEQVNYMHNQGAQNEFHGDTYNPSWRNHPNLRWGDNQNQNSWQRNSNQNNSRNTNHQNHQQTNQNPYRKPQNNYPNSNFYPPHNSSTNQNNFQQPHSPHTQPQPPEESQRISNLEMMMEKMMKHQELANKNHETSLRNLERQIGQLSKQPKKLTNTFASDSIPNPKEECKAIQLRSRRTLKDDKVGSKKEVAIEEKDYEELKKKDEEPQSSKKEKQVTEEHSQEQRKEMKPYSPPLQYPQRLQRELKDQQFLKFLEVFKKLEINIPLAKALEANAPVC